MNPKSDPASDSLVSGIPLNDQISPVAADTGIAPAISQSPAFGTGDPNQTLNNPNTDMQVGSFPASTAADTLAINQDVLLNQPVQPTNPLPFDPMLSNNPSNPGISETPLPANPQPLDQMAQNIQTTSPFDTPPAPPSQTQPSQAPVDLGNTIVEDKPKKNLPFFLILLLVLVVIVLGAVGYLAYQNYNLNKNLNKNSQPVAELTPPNNEAETDPYADFITYKSTIIPVEFMIPSAWKVDETNEPDLANQKMISVTSSDFAYENGEVSKGSEFRIGPVNDLVKKYDSFEAFSAEENSSNLYTQKIINETVWLVKGNEAKTLINNTPLTIALYAAADQTSVAPEMFTQILNTIKVVQPLPSIPTSTNSALPV